MRPPGDPTLLAAAARDLAAGAGELERLGRQATESARDLVAGDGWDGPASRAYLARDGTLEAGVRAAAGALRVTGEGLAGLAAGLAGAQATWERARALAMSSGLRLDPLVPVGSPLASPREKDLGAAVVARVSELLHEAEEQASRADRLATARLAEATQMATLASLAGRPAAVGDASGLTAAVGEAAALAAAGGAVGPGAVGEAAGLAAAGGAAALAAVGEAAALATSGGARPPAAPGADRSRHGEGGGSLAGRALDLADRVGVAVGAGLAAIEARAQALLRLVRSGREPAATLGAVRALAAFERSGLHPAVIALLPVAGPPLTLAANLMDEEHRGESLLRVVVRSLGESIGADAGQRLGMAVCGVDMGATGTAGAVLCPAVTITATAVGASLGGAAAVHVFDALGPDHHAAPAPEPKQGTTPTRPVPGLEPRSAPAPLRSGRGPR